MKIGKTCDASYYVSELTDELEPVFGILEKKYDVDLEIALCFRTLDENARDIIRYTKSDKTLWLDLAFSRDKYSGLGKSEQRQDLSDAFFSKLSLALRKYRFKGFPVDEFLADLEASMRQIGWRKELWEVALASLEDA